MPTLIVHNRHRLITPILDAYGCATTEPEACCVAEEPVEHCGVELAQSLLIAIASDNCPEFNGLWFYVHYDADTENWHGQIFAPIAVIGAAYCDGMTTYRYVELTLTCTGSGASAEWVATLDIEGGFTQTGGGEIGELGASTITGSNGDPGLTGCSAGTLTIGIQPVTSCHPNGCLSFLFNPPGDTTTIEIDVEVCGETRSFAATAPTEYAGAPLPAGCVEHTDVFLVDGVSTTLTVGLSFGMGPLRNEAILYVSWSQFCGSQAGIVHLNQSGLCSLSPATVLGPATFEVELSDVSDPYTCPCAAPATALVTITRNI